VTALLDTGFLLAVLDEDDDLHKVCVAALLQESQPVLPDVVLPELAFMVLRELGYDTLFRFVRSIVAQEVPLVRATPADLERSIEIMDQYRDSRIDFVDSVIAAIAERLGIRTIMTVDRTHFRLLRPRTFSYFTVVP
jgi:predicted nucleic acid-binding protein